jgi:predicted outer membrane repeat protein
VISDNTAWDGGGGIYAKYSLILNNLISGNSVVYHGGGGIYGGDLIISNNIVIENSSTYYTSEGGGIKAHGDSEISDNIIVGNRSAGTGGGIFAEHNSTISNSIIMGNSSEGDGGGIYAQGAKIANNIVSGNSSGGDGGGICGGGYFGYDLELFGNTIMYNQATNGGGVFCRGWRDALMYNNTITNNTADIYGGGLWVDGSHDYIISVINTIIRENHAVHGQEIASDGTHTLTVSYSNVQGGLEGVKVSSSTHLDWGPGNIDADPLFVVAEKKDYRLLWGSPCIDAGHPDYLDPDNTPSDIGAHYFDQNEYITFYLTPDTTRVAVGDSLGVTYTLINRWGWPETFSVESQVILPDSSDFTIFGPEEYTLPGEDIIQFHMAHDVPPKAPLGNYEYRSRTIFPVIAVPGEDSFSFNVVE